MTSSVAASLRNKLYSWILNNSSLLRKQVGACFFAIVLGRCEKVALLKSVIHSVLSSLFPIDTVFFFFWE
jgi:hypothetical protein